MLGFAFGLSLGPLFSQGLFSMACALSLQQFGQTSIGFLLGPVL